MNIERLQKIKEAILADPPNAIMDAYHATEHGPDFRTIFDPGLSRTLYFQDGAQWVQTCGTAHCIAGWAQVLFAPETFAYEAQRLGPILLGLPNYQLFYVGNWPIRLHEAYFRATNDKDRAKAMAAAIDDYIETGGWPEDL